MVRLGTLLRLALVVSVAGAMAGCGDDSNPTKPNVSTPPAYDTPSRPQLVLTNLITAYQSRDSVAYAAVYDSNYVGESTNLNDPNPATQFIAFTYAGEVRHLANMARRASISSVVMNLGSSLSWVRSPSDDLAHPEYALIQLQNVRIQIYEGNDVYNAVQGPGDVFQFRFKPSSPAATSPTDTLWNIIGWTEVSGP